MSDSDDEVLKSKICQDDDEEEESKPNNRQNPSNETPKVSADEGGIKREFENNSSTRNEQSKVNTQELPTNPNLQQESQGISSNNNRDNNDSSVNNSQNIQQRQQGFGQSGGSNDNARNYYQNNGASRQYQQDNNNYNNRSNYNNNNNSSSSNNYNRNNGNYNNNSQESRPYQSYNQNYRNNNSQNNPFNPQNNRFYNSNNNNSNNSDNKYFGQRNNNFTSSFNNNRFGYNNRNTVTPSVLQPEPLNSGNISAFISDNREYVNQILKSFSNLQEQEAGAILKSIYSNRAQTTFETMNDIAKENQIRNTIHFYQKEKSTLQPFTSWVDILECLNPADWSTNAITTWKYYKIFNIKDKATCPIPDLADEFFYKTDSERRRRIFKNEDGIYNYLPIKCSKAHDSNESQETKDNCIYAHTENEKDFHTLTYHTKLCTSDNCINSDLLCPNAHDIQTDFRLIYDYTDINITTWMNMLYKNIKKKDDYASFLKYDTKDFSLLTFKILPCKQNKSCTIDYHLCKKYHSNRNDKRRPPGWFKYCNKLCDKAYFNGYKEYNEKKCPSGIFCHYIHGIYELNYHEKNFRKTILCVRPKVRGQCPFINTCYGFHKTKEEEEDEKANSDMNSEINDWKTKYKHLNEKLEMFQCSNDDCGKWPDLFDFLYYKWDCGDLICRNCCKESIKKEKCSACSKKIRFKEDKKGIKFCFTDMDIDASKKDDKDTNQV